MQLFKKKFKFNSMILLLLNLLFILVLVFLFNRYSADYRARLLERNLNDISNLNLSSARMCQGFFDSRQQKLRDLAQYIRRTGMTPDEAMDYLYDANADSADLLELLDPEGNGFLLKQNEAERYHEVSYSDYFYAELNKLCAEANADRLGQVSFASEFTEAHTAYKCFALYTTLQLMDEDGQFIYYTLFSAARSSTFLDLISVKAGYDGLSTVLINQNGDYILSSSEFKSDNFFQYLYVFNDLSLDQKNQITDTVHQNSQGNLFYKNGHGKDCVFSYAAITDTDWYAVTAVPLTSLPSDSIDLRFSLIGLVLLTTLFLMDVFWFTILNRRLRISIAHERSANNAKTDFLSRMSHDIRTPLNGIIGMTLLAKAEPNPPSTQDSLEKIETSGKFLLGLVNDILDMSKVESGKMELHPEPYRYAELKGYLQAVVEPLCQSHGLQFCMDDPPLTAPLLFDRLRLNQIFFNLLSNSAKFTPTGGTISLHCTAVLLPDSQVELHFAVSDTGIGISPEFQKHMFEAFSQENRSESYGQSGSGLGLAIVWNLVHLMGGTLEVESTPGKGTTFKVVLTTKILSEESEILQPQQVKDFSALNGCHVLLCEDHDLNAEIAIRLLARKGVQTQRAQNGKIGLDLFAQSKPGTFDAVLMDVRMPVMDGLEATRRLRALPHPDAATIPVIAMTANAYTEDIQNCLNAGMNVHLSKPIDPNLLYSSLLEQILKH